MQIIGLVLRADGIVGAELGTSQCVAHVLMDSASLLNQTTQRSFGIRRPRVKQYAVANI